MRVFNTTAICVPSKHYMVDITDRISEIKKLVDDGMYFTINRARQYGKTTTLNALKNKLQQEYTVINLSFEGLTKANFTDEQTFVKAFCRLLKKKALLYKSLPDPIREQIDDYLNRTDDKAQMDELFITLNEWCSISEKPIVMFIDEVDSAASNEIFIDFLGLLRDGYISRDSDGDPTFHSVILAGVTDVKHLKSKIRQDSEEKENSPWNIAADFNIDMSLSKEGIKGMLDEYEADHHTGMNTTVMAGYIWKQTSGYPFLVSRICQLIDEQICKQMKPSSAWKKAGFQAALRILLAEKNTLFQTITKNLKNFPLLKAAIRSILMEGTELTYNSDQDDIVQMEMYGLIKNDNNCVKVANCIFETRLYRLFTSEEEMKNNVFFRAGELERNKFIKNGRLNMEAVLNGFIKTYNQVHGPLVDRFLEKDGRELFLLYIKPIINGTGNFYVEAQTRSQTRTDVVIDYLGEQFVIELKIWRGPRYNAAGEQQILGYLEHFDIEKGYMLSFNFNKKKEQGLKEVQISGKTLIEATL